MFLISAMDDTNLGSVRRSIFVYASLIVFANWYSLSINPNRLPGGIINVSENIVISTSMIVGVAAAFQVYLLVRLFVARPIALAKLHQAWGLEEMTKKDEFVKTVVGLQDMVEKSSKVTYPSKQLDASLIDEIHDIASGFSSLQSELEPAKHITDRLKHDLKKIGQEQQKLGQNLRKVLEELKISNPDLEQSVMKRSFKEEEIARGEDGGIIIGAVSPSVSPKFYDDLKQFDDMFSNETWGALQNFQEEASSLSKRATEAMSGISSALESFQSHVRYCENFPRAFEESNLSRLISTLKTDLVKARKKREREFALFEIGLPSFVAFVSLVVAGDVFWPYTKVVIDYLSFFVT